MRAINKSQLEITTNTLKQIKENLEVEIKKCIGNQTTLCRKVDEFKAIETLLQFERYNK